MQHCALDDLRVCRSRAPGTVTWWLTSTPVILSLKTTSTITSSAFAIHRIPLLLTGCFSHTASPTAPHTLLLTHCSSPTAPHPLLPHWLLLTHRSSSAAPSQAAPHPLLLTGCLHSDLVSESTCCESFAAAYQLTIRAEHEVFLPACLPARNSAGGQGGIGCAPASVVLWGRSLGTGVTIHGATQLAEPPAAV